MIYDTFELISGLLGHATGLDRQRRSYVGTAAEARRQRLTETNEDKRA